MENHPNIRPAEKADVVALKHVVEATELFPSEMLEDMISGYFDGTKSDLWFTYSADGQPVSIGFCEPERMTMGTWNLLAIGVLPEHQGKGIGAAMLSYLETVLLERDERVLLIETMGTPEFDLTRTFYEKNGYAKEARIREFYEAGADKIIFWKHLSNHG